MLSLARLWQIYSPDRLGWDSQVGFSVIHEWSAFGGPTDGGHGSNWKDELGCWLEPFLDRLGYKARRRMIAYAFPPAPSPHKSEAGKKNQRATASTNLASRAPRHRRPHHSTKSSEMSALPNMDRRGKGA
jgi:hypothetical protein